MDGRALQDAWERDGILIEGWKGNENDAPWQGIWTTVATYVEWDDRPPLWDRTVDPSEERNALTAANQDQWASWLDALRNCEGQACRDAESLS
jgi:hypothetical protein